MRMPMSVSTAIAAQSGKPDKRLPGRSYTTLYSMLLKYNGATEGCDNTKALAKGFADAIVKVSPARPEEFGPHSSAQLRVRRRPRERNILGIGPKGTCVRGMLQQPRRNLIMWDAKKLAHATNALR